MALTPRNNPNTIFAMNAPAQDKPAAFNNYERGMDEVRKTDGKPSIKQLNFMQQRSDQNNLYIHQNGAGLPWNSDIEYADGAPVVKDGILVQKSGNDWIPVGNKYGLLYVESIADLIAIQNPKEGQVVFVKSYNAGFFVGGGIFTYDSSKSAVNNNGTIINGWCRPKSKTINFNEFGLFDGKTYTSSVYFAPYIWGVENGYTKFNICNNVTITSPFTYSFSSDDSTSLEINGGKHIFDYGSPLVTPTDCILLWFSSNVDIELNIHIDCGALGSYIDQPIYVRSIFVTGGRKFTGKIRCENVYGYGLFSDCPSVEIDDYVAIDCWGNNIIKGTPAFDAYGDGLYLSCERAIVNNPTIINTKSISRAGIVVESLVAGKICNVTINNPKIKGYDRGIHSESMQADSSLTVIVNDGDIRECNTGNLVFSLSNAICDLTMNNVTQETLVRPNPVIDHDFPSGHIMGSGAGVSINTNGCTFMKQVASSQIIGNSAYESNNDTWLKGSIGIAAAWCNRFKITKLNGRECDGRIDFTATTRSVTVSNVDWGGTILIDNLDYTSVIKGINFIKNDSGNCGTLIVNSNIEGCRFKDITFDTPPANWYAIENNWIRDESSTNYDISNPSFDNIIVYGAGLFKNGGAVYRRTLPSFTFLDGITNKID